MGKQHSWVLAVTATGVLAFVVVGCGRGSSGDRSVEDEAIGMGTTPPTRLIDLSTGLGAGNKWVSDVALGDPAAEDLSGESYGTVTENAFLTTADHRVSTFGVDVDTASYSNVRRYLRYHSQLPPAAAVRTEELINYFSYDYPNPPDRKVPFSITTELGTCPWNPKHKLALIGLKGRTLDPDKTPPRNLVFLLDVSGSMQDRLKLPLVRRSMARLVNGLTDRDTVAIVTYAGAERVALTPTSCRNKRPILDCLADLEASGSTNGEGGIKKAYELAHKSFHKEHINRVILVTDGDFNVGVTDNGDLVELIEKQRDSGVLLTIVGVGTGNLQDDRMSQLAKHGNGQYIYLDGEQEARKHFERGLMGTLVTIAKDVKMQVVFNPAKVAGYRLIGYERRVMKKEDFKNDKKDSGEIGAGHSVTALYEVVPGGQPVPGAPAVSGVEAKAADASVPKDQAGDELLIVRLRYKTPWSDKSREVERRLLPKRATATRNLEFASAVAAFAMILGGSEHKGSADLKMVEKLARGALGKDPDGLRQEFVELVKLAGDMPPADGARTGSK